MDSNWNLPNGTSNRDLEPRDLDRELERKAQRSDQRYTIEKDDLVRPSPAERRLLADIERTIKDLEARGPEAVE